MNKKEEFAKAYKKYKAGEISDLEFLSTFSLVTKPADGLTWTDIEETIKEESSRIKISLEILFGWNKSDIQCLEQLINGCCKFFTLEHIVDEVKETAIYEDKEISKPNIWFNVTSQILMEAICDAIIARRETKDKMAKKAEELLEEFEPTYNATDYKLFFPFKDIDFINLSVDEVIDKAIKILKEEL